MRPATYCGVYGLKPTKGAISCLGGMALSPALDHPGPVARETADIALACRALFGVEADDPESMAVAPPELRPAPPGLRVLLVEGPLRARIEPPSREALDRARAALEASGLAVRAHDLPASFEGAEGCQDILLCRGVAQHHGRAGLSARHGRDMPAGVPEVHLHKKSRGHDKTRRRESVEADRRHAHQVAHERRAERGEP